MIYEQLYSDFKKLFPKNITLLDKCLNDANADKNDGMHMRELLDNGHGNVV